ncbi:MAG TPA: metalloregulator ArsR/SmtB family transcription factor [Actinomycetota bacterium]|nr:metalloregulator ArsR/SmtB family transcription factor [Actinomycetota bacterium]
MTSKVDPLQVVAEPRRRAILRLVWDRELPAGDIASRFDVSFPAVSQHLAVLRDAGFVSVRREGRTRLYRADPDALGPLRTVLEKMWTGSLDRLAQLAEEETRR